MKQKEPELPKSVRTFAILSSNGWFLLEDMTYGSLSLAVRFHTEADAIKFLADRDIDASLYSIENHIHLCEFLNLE